MRGQLFGMDAVIGLLVLFTALFTVSLTTYKTASVISEDLLLRRIELTVDTAVFKLLLSEGPWRCYAGSVPIPGCVVEGNFTPQKDAFFINNVDCNLEGSDPIASLMGCTSPIPSGAPILVSRSFEVCLTQNPSLGCSRKELRLTVWIGQ